MASSLGSLVVKLALDANEFTSGFTKSEYEAKKFARQIEGELATAARVAGFALAGLGLAGAAAFTVLRREISNVANFKQISEQIGDTAEAVAALKTASSTSGVAMESIAAASIKLTAGLSKTDDESKGAAAAIKAIGINLDEFLRLSPVAQMEKIATTLAKFEDGAGKTAFAVAAIGKAGPQVLPFLNDLAEAGGRQKKLTQEQIELADRYVKQQARTRAEIEGLIQVVAVGSLPAFTAFTGALTDTAKAMLGVSQESKKLTGNDVGEWAKSAASALGFVVDAGDGVSRTFVGIGKGVASFLAAREALLSLEPKRALSIFAQYAKDLDELAMRPLFSDRLAARLATPPPTAGPARPRLDPKLFAVPGAQTKEVDEFAKALERARELASDAGLELKGAFATEPITAAQKALDKLGASDVWSKLTNGQQLAITGIYKAVDGWQKEVAAVKAAREENERLIKVYQDIENAQAKAEERATQALGAYGEENVILARQLAILGQEDLAHQKLAEAIKYEGLLAQAKATEDIQNRDLTIAALEKEYATRIKLLEAFDAAAKQLRDIQDLKNAFGNAFDSAFSDFISGTKSAKDAFTSFTRSLEQDLARLAARKISETLFESLFGGLLGGGGAGLGGILESLAGRAPTPAFASGTNYAPGGMALVGERGPELVNLPRGAQVIPNDVLRQRRAERSIVVNNYTTIQGNPTRQTIDQMAIANANAVRRATKFT